MAITISGENNNDRILAQDGVIDEISGINIVGLLTAGHINVGSNIQLGNAGIITATTFNGNLTGNVNSTSPLLLQTGGSERFRITGNNELGIAGANYGSSGQVLTSGGSGSAVSWVTPAVTSFTNGSNNRVVTATSGSGLNGESELTYTGGLLKVAATYPSFYLDDTNTTNNRFRIIHNNELTQIDADPNNVYAGSFINISVDGSEKVRIDSGGKLRVASTTESADGAFDDVIVGNHSGNRGISILSGATSQGAIGFAKSGTLADGYVAYNHNSTATSSSMILKSSGRIQFNAGSVEKLRITSGGQVNIGGDYTQTAYNLSVTNTGGNLFRIKTANEGDYDLRFMIQNSESNMWHYGTDDFVFGNRYDRKLHFITNGSKRLTIHGSYIGINQTAPQTGLHINQDWVNSYGSVSVEGSANALVGLGLRSNGNYRGSLIWRDGSSGNYMDISTYGGAYPILFRPNGTERLRITSTGQLLLMSNTGYNPSSSLLSIATDASAAANMLSDSSTIYNHNNPAFVHVQNMYNTGTGQEAGIILHSKSSFGGAWAIYGKRTTSGYKSDLIFRGRSGSSSSAERLRIQSDGNIVMGHTATSNRFQIGNTGHSGYCIAANSPSYGAVIQVGDGATPGTAAALWIRNLNNGGGTTECFRVQGDGTAHFGNQSSTGKYNDGNTGASWYDAKDSWQQAQSGTLGWSMWYLNKIGGTGVDNRMIQFNSSGSAIGYISRSGSNIVYQTSSDYRLKKDVVALPNGIDRVKQLRPVAFKWIEDNSDMEGFLAHEAQEVVPYAVSGKKDEVATEDHGDRKKGDMIVQAIDYGEFTPLLTAAMKELIAKVEILQAEVAALKGS